MLKHEIPNTTPMRIKLDLAPHLSAKRLTIATITALIAVLKKYNVDIADRENPVSAIIESINTEKTKDWPGPLLNATKMPTMTIIQP